MPEISRTEKPGFKMMMNSTDLGRFIELNEINAEILHLESETLTVAAAAEALGVLPEQIIKSVLFLAGDRPVLVVTNGLTRINRKLLADGLSLSRKRVKMAGGDQVLEITGYPIGAVPPFGHPQPLETLLDEGVLLEEVVFGGGGETNALMRVPSVELMRVTRAKKMPVSDR